MPRYHYTPEESLINGLTHGASGVLEGFILTVIVNVFGQSLALINPSGAGIFLVALLILFLQSVYLILRIFIAFTHMKQLGTVIYYFTFTASYIWFNLYLGDRLSAFMVLFAVFLSVLVRVKMEEYERPVL